jgi:hypothetical protein
MPGRHVEAPGFEGFGVDARLAGLSELEPAVVQMVLNVGGGSGKSKEETTCRKGFEIRLSTSAGMGGHDRCRSKVVVRTWGL